MQVTSNAITLLYYVLLLPVYPVTDASPPSYEELYSSADLNVLPSYNEALSPHHITTTVTSSTTHSPLQTEPVATAAVRVVSQNSPPQQTNANRQVNSVTIKLRSVFVEL